MATILADELLQKLGLTPRHRPRRVVTRSGWRVRGITPSLRFRTSLKWESDIEHRLIYRLLTSWLIKDACTQAVRLQFPEPMPPLDCVGAIDYTPDALVKDHTGTLTCIECKPAAQLIEPELQKRHRDIRLFLNAHGVRFIEVTDKDLATTAPHENAKLLIRGIQSIGPRTDTLTLRDEVRRLLPCPFDMLIAQVGVGRARAALFHGFGYFDMHRPLTGATVITNHLEEHFDAANFIHT